MFSFFSTKNIFEIIRTGTNEELELAISKGVDANQKEGFGFTPLMAAAEFGLVEKIEMLIKAGANLDQASSIGMTALMWAAENNRINAIKSLLEAGADPNKVTNSGLSSIFFAAEKGHSDAVKMLLLAGGDPTVVNSYGARLLDLTIVSGNLELVNSIKTAIILWKKNTLCPLSQDEGQFFLSSDYDREFAMEYSKLTSERVAWKVASKQKLSALETVFWKFKLYNEDYAQNYLENRAGDIIEKLKSFESGQREVFELNKYESSFLNNDKYFKSVAKFNNLGHLLHINADKISNLLFSTNKDTTLYIFSFLPREEVLVGQTPLLVASELNDLENDDVAYPQVQYGAGIFVGILIGNPTIRYLRDQVNGENKDKALSEYYNEIFGVDVLSHLATGLVVPITTKVVSAYLGIPEYLLNGNNYLPNFAAAITDSLFAQGFIQSAAIEGAGLLGDVLYCQFYDCNSVNA